MNHINDFRTLWEPCKFFYTRVFHLEVESKVPTCFVEKKQTLFETRKYKKVVVQCSVLVMWMFAESYPQIDREFSTYSPRIFNRIPHMFTFWSGRAAMKWNNIEGTHTVRGCTILKVSHDTPKLRNYTSGRTIGQYWLEKFPVIEKLLQKAKSMACWIYPHCLGKIWWWRVHLPITSSALRKTRQQCHFWWTVYCLTP